MTHPNAFTGTRRLASGRWAAFENGSLVGTDATEDGAAEFLYGPDEGPACSICDALGHGYPGGGPCPLEETGEDDPRERALWALEDAARAEREARWPATVPVWTVPPSDGSAMTNSLSPFD